MKKATKLLALFLALSMVFMLAACKSTGGTTESSAPEGNNTTPPADNTSGNEKEPGTSTDLKVAVFWYNYADAFMSTVRTALNQDLDAAGISYQDYDGGNNQATQLEQVQTAVTNGYNLLVVNLVTSGSASAAKEIIDAAGSVPVVFFNRAVEGEGEEGTVLNSYDNICFIGTDAPEAGHMQGKMIGDYLVEHYDDIDLNKDGVISYAMFMGDKANVEAIYRTQYGVEDANAVLKDAGKKELSYFNASNTDKYQLDPNGAWSNAAAFDFMSTNLAEYNEANGNMIELIIANNDDMALGAISALQAAGYNDGKGKTIPVFGVDATDVAKDAISKGQMTGSVKQDAEGMATAITEVAKAVSSGKSMADAVSATAGVADIFSAAEGFTNKLFVAYAPYTG